MSFDWNEYATLAEELSRRDNEASLRTAISRIYYSTYHEAKTYLLDEGIQLSTSDSSHKIIWNGYKNMGRSCRSVGLNGERLFDNRKKADYESEVGNINQLVEESFIIARNILVYLKQCKASRVS
jgi:uncharacterized protein (UPF0332 family)